MFDTAYKAHQIAPSVFIASGAVVVGDVTIAAESSVWFNATLRGDTEPLMIGARSNIQDNAVFHADPGFPVIVGTGVTIGHGAIIHGARIGNNSLIGMGAVLLNGATVGEHCIVGANSLIPEGKVFPAGSLILGSPAKRVRALTEAEIAGIHRSAEGYVHRGQAFRDTAYQQPIS